MAQTIQTISSIISCIASIFACVFAWLIPNIIKWEQFYNQLLSDYRGYDFAAAVQGVVSFFYDDCKNNVEEIQDKYEVRFKKDFTESSEYSCQTVSNDKNLHYQRRLLTQFYYDIDRCCHSHFIKKSRIQKDFTSNEANILKVVFYMNEAISNSSILFKDISCSDRLKPNSKGINLYIKDLHSILKNQASYIK